MVFISKLIVKRDGIIKHNKYFKKQERRNSNIESETKTAKINSNISRPIMDINEINTPVEKLAFWVC